MSKQIAKEQENTIEEDHHSVKRKLKFETCPKTELWLYKLCSLDNIDEILTKETK